MKTMWGVAALALAATGARAEVPMHGPESTAKQILAAERAFAAMAEKETAAKAFRWAMDPVDGLEFVPGGPARGADAIFKAQGGDTPETGKLRWEPDEVFASTGDMGLTWGHWTFTPIGAEKAVAHGKYVTVWRRNAKGEWKGLIDIGNPDK